MKFKVGDKVKIIQHLDGVTDTPCVNSEGVVRRLCPSSDLYPYFVQLNSGSATYFFEEEIVSLKNKELL